ncbi:hypothetical protein KIW84_010789 [Lathyrus oleraceus]|uniref:Uncharacterized protein n=1 Tax=Pisum sativum TaxID=3888 RepID=A0A9D4YNT5_PEA|nr:hypothetical protein KIW84_010789 [Pisum sativum]
MENNNNMWPSSAQAFTGSNHGEQPQPELGIDRKNRSGRGDGIQDETSVVTNIGSNCGNEQKDSKGKLGFLTRAVAEPTTEDPRYKQWKSENSLIIE